MIVRPARIADWSAVLDLYNSLQCTRASEYINATLDELSSYLANSLVFPGQVGFLLLEDEIGPLGLAALCIVGNPQLHMPGVPTALHGFIHAVYVRPFRVVGSGKECPSRVAGLVFCDAIGAWFAERGAGFMFGNVRPDGPIRGFLRKYGFEPFHIVIGRPTAKGGYDGQVQKTSGSADHPAPGPSDPQRA